MGIEDLAAGLDDLSWWYASGIPHQASDSKLAWHISALDCRHSDWPRRPTKISVRHQLLARGCRCRLRTGGNPGVCEVEGREDQG
jgi:hypothetical protein